MGLGGDSCNGWGVMRRPKNDLPAGWVLLGRVYNLSMLSDRFDECDLVYGLQYLRIFYMKVLGMT